MKQNWIFSVRYYSEDSKYAENWEISRSAVVGAACIATVEEALELVVLSDSVRSAIRRCDIVRRFIEDKISPSATGYYHMGYTDGCPWTIGIGPVHKVLG